MRAGESDKTGWPFFLAVMIVNSTWHSIFERLRQLGYEREVTYFGSHRIKLSCKALFRKSKPLADNGKLSPNDITSTGS
jgi:tryptophan-rich sensory protein